MVARKATTPMNTAMMRIRTWTQLTLGAARTCNVTILWSDLIIFIGPIVTRMVLIGQYLRASLHAGHCKLVKHGAEPLVAGLVQQLVDLVQVDNILIVQNLGNYIN